MAALTTRLGPRYGLYGVAAPVVIALAATVATKPSEGLRLPAYRDMVGVLTVCWGHTDRIGTQKIDPNKVYTVAECQKLLDADEQVSYGYEHHCITRPMPLGVDAALLDATFNLGPGVVCGSHIQRWAMQGQWQQVCDGLWQWKNAGGHVVSGLVKRRALEIDKLCLEGF